MGEARLTADEVVATARQLVEDHGPEALTVRRLAACLYCAPPAIYRRIGDKATLQALLCDQIIAEMVDHMMRVDAVDPLVRHLCAISNLLDYCEQHPNSIRLYLLESTASTRMVAHPLLVAYVTSTRNAVKAWGHRPATGKAPFDAPLTVDLAVGAIARLAAVHPPDSAQFRQAAGSVFRLALLDSGIELDATSHLAAFPSSTDAPNVDLRDRPAALSS